MAKTGNDITELASSSVVGGVPIWRCVNRLGPEPENVEPVGEAEIFQALGVTSLPYPPDENGKAEGVIMRGVAGRPATCVGARDTRSAAIVGNLKPGDTVLHSTGPSQAAQVQCKEVKRQVLMATKDPNGKTMIAMLDGKNNKFQLVLAGMIFEFNGNTKNISISNGQCQILMQGSTICLDGDVILGGKVADPVNKVAICPTLTPGVPATPGVSATFGAAASVSVALPGA